MHTGVDVMYRRKKDGSEPKGLPYGTENYYMPANTPARAAAAGRVVISKDIKTGGYVRIDHGDGVVTQSMHLLNRKVQAGQAVAAGQPLGIISHNRSPGGYPLDHLHFELLIDGVKIDPQPIMTHWARVSARVLAA